MLHEISHITRCKIQQSTHYSCYKRKAYARSAYLHKDSSDYHHHEDGLKQWIQEEINQSINPSQVILHILDNKLIISSYCLYNFNFTLIYSFAVSDLHCLLRSQTQHVGSINHGLRNLRVSSCRLGRRTHHSAHE